MAIDNLKQGLELNLFSGGSQAQESFFSSKERDIHVLFSTCREWEILSTCDVQASHPGSFSCCRARALG